MRSAHALDTPRDQHWDTRAECRHDPEMWFTHGSAGPSRLALHICAAHCPVLAECRAYAERQQPSERRSFILGGVGYNHSGRPLPVRGLPRCTRCEVTP
jgi:hypothetical protein